MIHRDVKPENVLVTQRSGREHAFLTDFAVTRRAEEEPLTWTGAALGSADYMTREQALGSDVDARADVYSLGLRAVPHAHQRGERSGLDRFGLSAEPGADAQVGTITDTELGAALGSAPADANPPLSARPGWSAAGYRRRGI